MTSEYQKLGRYLRVHSRTLSIIVQYKKITISNTYRISLGTRTSEHPTVTRLFWDGDMVGTWKFVFIA